MRCSSARKLMSGSSAGWKSLRKKLTFPSGSK
jgi:hypothetical protein